MATIPERPFLGSESQPAWEIALLFPSQGEWDEHDYLGLHTNHLVELVDGKLEVLRMPTIFHQGIARFLFKLLSGYADAEKRGTVYFAPLPIRIRAKTFREPDIIYIASEHLHSLGEKYLTVADLVMEVVSSDDESHKRDYDKKRADYAEAGIPEYWIVDPGAERITVLCLEDKQYQVHGEFVPGEQASSVLLPGFVADVTRTFAAARVSL
jgi:Uma2 family endonuclease